MLKQIMIILSISFLASCSPAPNLENLEDMVGDWKLTGTSGGFTGAGFDAKFDYISINKDLDFILYNENIKMAEGKITEKTSDTEDILLEFSGTKEKPEIWYDIIDDNEKYLRFMDNNEMELYAPCCDRYNTNWEKD